jgi:hypothetical protein
MADKDVTTQYNISTIKESIISGEIQEANYLRAVTEGLVPSLSEILNNKKKYKDIIEENGTVNARFLLASFYVLDGKTADNYMKFGEYFIYFDENKKWKELGDFENRTDFLRKVNFPRSEAYCSQAAHIYNLIKIGRLEPDRLIKLGSKATLVSQYIVEDLNNNELMKLVKQLERLTFREAQHFMRSGEYKYFLAGEKIPEEKKRIFPTKKQDGEYVHLKFDMPKVKVSKDQKSTEYRFPDPVRQQVWNMAITEMREEIADRMTDIINRPEGEAWRKKLIKE